MGFGRDFVKLLVLFLPVVFVLSSCKKKKAFKEENGQTAEDIRRVQVQCSEVVTDINITIMEQSLLRGKGLSETETAATQLCGVVVDTSSVFKGITRLNYDGTSCKGIKKSGQIVVSIQDYPLKKWKHQGALLKIDFVEYKVTGADGRNIQIDGTAYMTNVSGNTWYEMRYLNASKLVQTHSAENLKVTYDGDNTAIFHINRRITFNYAAASKITSCTIEGMGSFDGRTNLDNWGQNRDGLNFSTKILTPVLWKSSCGSQAPIEGEAVVKVDGKDFEMNCRFGVDEQGDAISGSDTCPYGWKISWSYKRKTSSLVFAYS